MSASLQTCHMKWTLPPDYPGAYLRNLLSCVRCTSSQLHPSTSTKWWNGLKLMIFMNLIRWRNRFNVAATCPRCFDRQVLAVYLGLPASCNTDNFNPRDFCSDECVGASCTFYSDNGYPTDCRTDLAQFCTDGGMTAPAACGSDSGPTQATGGSTSALVAVKEVAVLLLLVTVLLVF